MRVPADLPQDGASTQRATDPSSANRASVSLPARSRYLVPLKSSRGALRAGVWLPPSAGTACRVRCLRWCLSSFGLGKISLGNCKMPIVTEEVWGVAKDAASPRSLPEPLLLVWRPHCERQGYKSFKVLCILYVNWGPKNLVVGLILYTISTVLSCTNPQGRNCLI